MAADALPLQTTANAVLESLAPTECPVCHKDHDRRAPDDLEDFAYPGERHLGDEDEIHHAAHCCLWRSYDHAARTRIAQRVEEGSNWAEAIQGERNV